MLTLFLTMCSIADPNFCFEERAAQFKLGPVSNQCILNAPKVLMQAELANSGFTVTKWECKQEADI